MEAVLLVFCCCTVFLWISDIAHERRLERIEKQLGIKRSGSGQD